MGLLAHFRSVKSFQVGLKVGYTALYMDSFTAHLRLIKNIDHKSKVEGGIPDTEEADSPSMVLFGKR